MIEQARTRGPTSCTSSTLRSNDHRTSCSHLSQVIPPRLWTAGLLAAIVPLAASIATAQIPPQRAPTRGRVTAVVAPRGPHQGSTSQQSRYVAASNPLSSVMLFRQADALLSSSRSADRLQAIRMLGATGSYEAAALIVNRLTHKRRTRKVTYEERREAAWALAPFAGRPRVGQFLISCANAGGTLHKRLTMQDREALDTCALALTSSGAPSAFSLLIGSLTADSVIDRTTSNRAYKAILAHPPSTIDQLLTKQSLDNITVLKLLGELGDLRAVPALRRVMKRGGIRKQIAAALALAKLGDGLAAAPARHWLSQPGQVPKRVVVFAQILALLRDPMAPRAIAITLADPTTRNAGLQLAYANPTPQLAPFLAGLLAIPSVPRRPVLVALAQTGTNLAKRSLLQQARKHPHDTDVAWALTHLRGEPGDEALDALLGDDDTMVTATRAAVVRWFTTGRIPPRLDETVGVLLTSKDPAKRAVGAWANAVMARSDTRPNTCNRFDFSVGLRRVCELATPASNRVWRRGADALPFRPSFRADQLSDRQLIDWATSPSIEAPLFARLVGARANQALREDVERLLNAADPAVRTNVAIGLGWSKNTSVVARLRNRYLHESNATVRAAIVRGLSGHDESSLKSWLRKIAALDPDESVRALAQAASQGADMTTPRSGDQVIWVNVKTPPRSTKVVARVSSPTGWTTVTPVSPDGTLIVLGVPTDRVDITLSIRNEPEPNATVTQSSAGGSQHHSSTEAKP